MKSAKIAVVLDSLHEPLRKGIATAAGFGARGVVLTAAGDLAPEALSETGRRELRRLLESVELEPAALVFRSQRALTDPEGIEARMEALRETLSMSYQIRAPVVCCRLGPLVAQDEPRRALFEQTLLDLGQFAERTGATLSLWSGANAPDALAGLLATHETGGLGVSYDPAMLLAAGFDPVEAVAQWRGIIAHVHVRDVVRGGSAESSHEVPLGQGEVDWPECLGALEEADYRGYFAVERNTGSDPRRDVSNAVAYLRSLMLS
jgi:L-ribulose-5-phosphate 3-epimerase